MNDKNPKQQSSMSKTIGSMRSPIVPASVDAKLLMRAWDSMCSVLKDVVAVIEKNEADNQSTRENNKMTWTQVRNRSRIVFVTVLFASTIGLLISAWFATRMYEMEHRAIIAQRTLEEAKGSLAQAREETRANNLILRDALGLLRQTSKVQGMRAERDAEEDADDESKEVVAEAIELQAKAIAAEKKAAVLSKEKPPPETDAEIKKVRAKARRLKVPIDPKLDEELK